MGCVSTQRAGEQRQPPCVTFARNMLPVFSTLIVVVVSLLHAPGSSAQGLHVAPFVRSSLPGPWTEPWEPVNPQSCLPQLMLLGAQKAGILPWYWYTRLGYHPGLMVSKVENIEFFNLKYNTTVMTPQKYTHLFPRICKRDEPLENKCSLVPEEATTTSSIRCDVSPHYLANPFVPQRVAQLLPDMRFLVILRNPTHRTVSQFNMWWQLTKIGTLCTKGNDCNFNPWNASQSAVSEVKQHYIRDLYNMVDTITGELNNCYRAEFTNSWTMFVQCLKLKGKSNQVVHGELDRISYIWYSMYVDQLAWWMQQFQSSKFLIWSSADFHQNPEAHMSQLVEWLGLPLAKINTEVKLSRTIGSAMYISKIPKELVTKLNNFYRPHNERLFTLLIKKGFGITAEKLRRDFK